MRCSACREIRVRRKTREVMVGNVGVGGDNPIRIQSMTTTSTRDIDATVEQIIRLADEGCEIARVTVQGKKEAYACEGIKNQLVQKGYTIPLVADIHFYPPAAMLVAEYVDKVRVNPGNYVDRRADFRVIEYDDAAYALELEKIEEGFSPLVEKCKKRGIAMRIGTNHGSLSDRIMNRFGDSPAGMVESAIEFTNVCRKYDYHDIIYSMKASNAVVMIEAYRLLVKRMDELGWDYPLHLGVTEAGNGQEGRVKSSVGTGGLLLEGLGDTIRVSLTEDPWCEIEPCKRIITHANVRSLPKREKRARAEVNPPLHRDGSVIVAIDTEYVLYPNFYERIGCEMQLGRPQRKTPSADALLLKEPITDSDALGKLKHCPVPTVTKEDYCFYNLQGPLPETDKPIILCYEGTEDPVIRASAECGSLLTDGWGEGICLYNIDEPLELSFNILQAARMRATKTEFIACPSCGRTLFDLQSVTKRIQEKTSHLPGVKIAIMGCIVNGPGEMADADFGYVGSRPGMIDLYVGKTCVEKNIPEEEALMRLIELIKVHDRWIEPVELVNI